MLQKTEDRKKKFIEAYTENGFKVGKSCKGAGITRMTFRRWLKEDEQFAIDVQEAEENTLDDVEVSLLKRAKGYNYTETKISVKTDEHGKVIEKTTTTFNKHMPPDTSAARDILKAKARHRGYGMKDDDSDAGQHVDDE